MKQQKTIVKAKEVIARTNWTKEQMRKARKLGWVKYFDNENGRFYILESIINPYEKQAL